MLYPKALSVQPLANYHIEVVFSNGEKGIFDLTPYIHGDWFGELADERMFRTVHVEGLSVAWEDGQDIAPDCLYANSVKTAIA